MHGIVHDHPRKKKKKFQNVFLRFVFATEGKGKS